MAEAAPPFWSNRRLGDDQAPYEMRDDGRRARLSFGSVEERPPAASDSTLQAAKKASTVRAQATAATTRAAAAQPVATPSGPQVIAVAPTPPAQGDGGIILGPGDVVIVNVLGRPELTTTLDVSGDGSIAMPLAGQVEVVGLSTAAAADRVARRLREGDFVIDPQVTLTMAETRSQQISVLGEVKQPGRFPMQTRTTVLDAIAQAGGVAETGMNFAYILRRQGGVVVRHEMDMDALLKVGSGQEYFELQSGDTVVVPKAERFYIYGEVKAPDAYILKSGMGIIQALSLAGGLTDKGSDRRIEIRRRQADGSLQTLTASLSDPVRPDDVIYVKERFF